MAIQLHKVTVDTVVDAIVCIGETSYSFALDRLLPLISRLDMQRRVQDPKFYERLKRDIINGCVMPPITLAFLDRGLNRKLTIKKTLQDYCNDNIDDGFVLDGIQRLNTLASAKAESPDALPANRLLFVNVLICPSMDSLLYRMITLNNGQRPMTMRHQVEILMEQVDFSGTSLKIRSEKEGGSRKQGYFRQADVVLAYLAFLSGSTTVDTQKLIEERLDQILAAKVLETPPQSAGAQFFDALKLIERWCKEKEVEVWFKVTNNLIGFSAGARKGLPQMRQLSAKQFLDVVRSFEGAFSGFDVSKIKLGQARRDCLAYFVEHFGVLRNLDLNELTNRFTRILS